LAQTREDAEELAFSIYLADYHKGSEMVKQLSKAQRTRFEALLRQFKLDTKGELSEVEYFWLTKCQYFCEFIETEILINGVQKCPMTVLKFYEQARRDVLDLMRRYRENKDVKNTSIEGLKQAIKELVDEKGELKLAPKKEFVDVSREPIEADPGHGGGVDDQDPVRDPEGDSQPAGEAGRDG
jgi:hypothetical protein